MKTYKKIIISSLVIISIIVAFIFVFGFFYDTHNKSRYSKTVNAVSQKYEINENVIFAIIKTESNFAPNAKSRKNALGIMQIKKETFEFVCDNFKLDFSVNDIFDANKNIEVGVCYLKYLIDKFKILDVAICAYNAGEGNVSKWLLDKRYSNDGKTLKDIPYKETRDYLSKIKFYTKVFEKL